jgi:acyl carrier protein
MTMTPEQLNGLSLKLKRMLIEECNVKNCSPEDIGDDDQLIGGSGRLKLDSLDAVEIVSALERNHGIRLDNPGEARKVLRTFASLRDYVIAHGTGEI